MGGLSPGSDLEQEWIMSKADSDPTTSLSGLLGATTPSSADLTGAATDGDALHIPVEALKLLASLRREAAG